MHKFKKALLTLLVLSLPLEISFFHIGGKDVKFWLVLSILGGVVIFLDFWKRGLKEITNLKTFYFGTLFVLFSLIAIFNSPIKSFSFQQLIILSLLVILSMFIEKYSPMFKKETFFALAVGMFISSVVAIMQNVMFDRGIINFEIMAARPNSFFPEPDWLGFYLALGLIFYVIPKNIKSFPKFLTNKLVLAVFWIVNIMALTISVARASWLAFFCEIGLIVFLFSFSKYLKEKNLNKAAGVFAKKGASFLLLILISLSLVQIFHLTRFNLFDRARSIFFKEHIITLAVDPLTHESVKINLEEKEGYIKKGFEIKESYVEDENVASRENKAVDSWEIIQRHPILGSGLGITLIETNYQHNANNLFLEWWASAGIGGIITIIALLIYFFIQGVLSLKENILKTSLLVAGTFGFIVLNLFNASIFLAFTWFFLGYLLSITKKQKE